MDYTSQLLRFFDTCNGKERPMDLYFDLYCLLCSLEPPKQHLALAFIIRSKLTPSVTGNGHRPQTLYSPEAASQALDLTKSGFWPQLEKLIAENSQNAPSEDGFYHAVWHRIRTSPLMHSKLERSAALMLFVKNALPSENVTGAAPTDHRNFFTKLLSSCNGKERAADVCLEAYRYILTLPEENRHLALLFLMENGPGIEKKGPGRIKNPTITDLAIAKAQKKVDSVYIPHIKPLFDRWVDELEDDREIYRRLWTELTTTELLSDPLEIAVLLHRMSNYNSPFYSYSEEPPKEPSAPPPRDYSFAIERLKELTQQKNSGIPMGDPEVREFYESYIRALEKKVDQ